jgi:ABC-type oligopeptide transport system substrate-binding subunit
VHERPLADLAADISAGRFDLAVTALESDDAQLASERWRGLVSPWFDALAELAARAPDRSEKRALYAEMQRIWTAALPALPLYQELRVDVAPQALAEVQPPPSGAALSWNAWQWTFVVR